MNNSVKQYENMIVSQEKVLETIQKNLSKNLTLMSIVIKNTVSSKKNAVNKFDQYRMQYLKAKNIDRKIHFLNKMIDYTYYCKNKFIDLSFNKDTAYASLRTNQSELKHDVMMLSYDFKECIRSLCNNCINCLKKIDSTKKHIESLNKQLTQSKNQSIVDELKEVKETININDVPHYSNKGTYSNRNNDVRSTQVSSTTHTPLRSSNIGNDMGIKSLVVYDIDKIADIKTQNKSVSIFDYNEYVNKIKKHLSKRHHTYNFCSLTNKIINNYELANKVMNTGHIRAGIKYNPNDLIESALNVYEISPSYLEEKQLVDIDETSIYFFRKFNVNQCLSEYEKMYNKYMKAYSFMTGKNKEHQMRRIMSSYNKSEYERIFGTRNLNSPKDFMVSPEELRQAVNNKIINDMKNNSSINVEPYFKDDYEYRPISYNTPDLNSITMYMNKEDIVRLYKIIKSKHNDIFIYSMTPVDTKKELEGLKNFQTRIVSILARKIYGKEIIGLSDEEVIEFMY